MPGNPLSDPTWAPKLADNIERLAGKVRDKTTKPLLIAYRGVVYGLIALFTGVFAMVILIIVGVRGLQALIGIGTNHDDAVWISYLGLGAVLTAIGAFVMSKRFPQDEASR